MRDVLNPSPTDIRAAREAAGLSQTAAGALCHRSLRAWQFAEAGERNLDAAAWELFLLRTGQHPTHRLIARRGAAMPAALAHARDYPANTCAASRHVAQLAEAIAGIQARP